MSTGLATDLRRNRAKRRSRPESLAFRMLPIEDSPHSACNESCSPSAMPLVADFRALQTLLCSVAAAVGHGVWRGARHMRQGNSRARVARRACAPTPNGLDGDAVADVVQQVQDSGFPVMAKLELQDITGLRRSQPLGKPVRQRRVAGNNGSRAIVDAKANRLLALEYAGVAGGRQASVVLRRIRMSFSEAEHPQRDCRKKDNGSEAIDPMNSSNRRSFPAVQFALPDASGIGADIIAALPSNQGSST